MARSKPQHISVDFSDISAETLLDPYGERRQMQARLYQLDNPYVGNKRGILVDIADALEKNDVKFNSVLDLFSGSGVVSIFFKLMGKTVISNDLLTSSYYNSLAFCENQNHISTKEDLKLLGSHPNPMKGTFVKDNYGHRFAPEECDFLDNYRANVQSAVDAMVANGLPARTIEIKQALSILAVTHYVLNRCFLGGRLNKGQVLADLKHRIDHNRNRGNHLRFQIAPLPSFFNPDVNGCKAYNLDALEAAKQVRINHPKIEMAYIDPPYGQSQSDYATMFGFCEEYVHSKKLDQLDHIESASKKFSQKKNYTEHFKEVLDTIRWIPTWSISYNATSFKDIDGIKSIVGEYKSDIKIVEIAHKYKYRKERSSAIEYLIIAK